MAIRIIEAGCFFMRDGARKGHIAIHITSFEERFGRSKAMPYCLEKTICARQQREQTSNVSELTPNPTKLWQILSARLNPLDMKTKR